MGWGYFLVSYTHLRWKLTLRIMTRPYKTVILELDYGFIQPTPMCHGFNANLSARYRMVIEFKSSHSDIFKPKPSVMMPNHVTTFNLQDIPKDNETARPKLPPPQPFARYHTKLCKISQRTMISPNAKPSPQLSARYHTKRCKISQRTMVSLSDHHPNYPQDIPQNPARYLKGRWFHPNHHPNYPQDIPQNPARYLK